MRVARRWQKRAAADLVTDAALGCLYVSCAPEVVLNKTLDLNTEADMRELLPGFVHMQGVLPLHTQQMLLEMSCAVAGEARESGTSGGWYRLLETGQWKLNDGSKARFWDDISRFPPEAKSLGAALAQLVAHRFPSNLAAVSYAFEPRVCALNFYTPHGRMGWHVDDTNFAKAEKPIIMANLGDAADFGYKAKKSDKDLSVRLESGDVVVFGGPSRNLVHALLQVHPQTSPLELQFPKTPGVGRVSVTWRDVGAEDGLTFNSDERLGLTVTEQTLPRYISKGKGKGR